MYLILEKKTNKLLGQYLSYPGEKKEPVDLMPDFDAKTMVMALFEGNYVPARFEVVKGVVRDLDVPQAVSLEALKAARLAEVEASFQQLSNKVAAAANIKVLKGAVLNPQLVQMPHLAAQHALAASRVTDLRQRIAKAESVPELELLRIELDKP